VKPSVFHLRSLDRLGLIMPYVGGKRQLLPQIMPHIPPHKKYVELFVGGGALFFTKPPARENVINDADPFLVKFYRDFTCKKLDKCKKITNVCAFATGAKNRVIKGSADLCDQIAARRFTIVASIRGAVKKNECKTQPVITKTLIRHCPEFEARLNNAKIENMDFRAAFKKHDSPSTFTFADPPYPDTEQPYRPQKVDKMKVHPIDVCDLARKAKGKVLITYNEHPVVRASCKGLHIKSVPSKHRAAHVTRHSANRRELLIANFPL